MRNTLAHPNWSGIGVIVGVIVAIAIAIGTIIYTNNQSKANIIYSYFWHPVSVPIIGGGEIYSPMGVWLVIGNDGPSVGNSVLVHIQSKVPIHCYPVDQKDLFLVRLQPAPQITSTEYSCDIYYEHFFVEYKSFIIISRGEEDDLFIDITGDNLVIEEPILSDPNP